MLHNAAFHQDLHFLLRLKQSSGTEKHQNFEKFYTDPLKYTIGSAIVTVSICMGKSIRIQRVYSLQSIHKINMYNKNVLPLFSMKMFAFVKYQV